MTPTMPTTLLIERLWNGAALPQREHASVALRWIPGGLALDVEAPFHDDPAPPARPGPSDRLWEFEVVEIVRASSTAGCAPLPYTEFELSPHGHYLVLRPLGPRNPIDFALPLAFRAEIDGARWRGRAVVP